MFTHYTHSLDGLLGIVAQGFAWVPNPRKLTSRLIPQHNFTNREPQQFGMISFTEIGPTESKKHRQKFGQFGICVSEAWAQAHQIERVIYVASSGPSLDAWQAIFAAGYRDLKARIEDSLDAALLMAYENKAIAGVSGATLWASLLQLYEYMEPSENAEQREWRIINTLPNYSLMKPVKELIEDITPPQNWAQANYVNRVIIAGDDITAFICPHSEYNVFRESLPETHRSIEVIQTDF